MDLGRRSLDWGGAWPWGGGGAQARYERVIENDNVRIRSADNGSIHANRLRSKMAGRGRRPPIVNTRMEMLIIFIFLALIGRRICKPSHLLLLLLLLLLLIYSGGRPWHLEAVTSALAPFQPVKCNNGRRIRFKRNKRKEIEINGRAYASTCTLGFPIEIINELVQVEWMLRRWFGMWPRGSGGASGSGSGGGGGSRSLRRLNVPFSKDSLNCDYAKWFA